MAVSKDNTQSKPKEFELDTPSNIYPALMTKKGISMFRVSVVLKQPVQPDVLKQAIHDLKDRFPTFYVQLKKGFYKYKLISIEDTDVLTEETGCPLKPVVVGSGQKPMFRVLYTQNRVSLEIFHLITDGGGALLFLKNIVARYLRLQGCQFENTDGVLDINEEPKAAEMEDSFGKLYEEGLERISRTGTPAYKYMPEFKENYLSTMNGLIPVDELKKVTKAKGVTITAYLTALYIYALYLDMLPAISEKSLKISVPLELRRQFDSVTVRNFSFVVNIVFLPVRNDHTFDEILAECVKGFNEGVDKEKLKRFASTNISDIKSVAYRFTPLAVKNFILRTGFKLYGTKLITTTFSNFGVVTVPKGMEEYIDHFGFMLGSGEVGLINCSAVAFGNILNLNFSSASEATNIQNLFFSHLAERGVNITIQNNIYDKRE